MHMLAVLIVVSGRVQGVGFRWWARERARHLHLSGRAENLFDGRVELLAQGEPHRVREFLRTVIEQPSTGSRPGRVDDYELSWPDPDPRLTRFDCY